MAEIFAKTAKAKLPPGDNLTPRSQSAPPPPEAREGETLNLPFPSKPGLSSAKQRNKGPGPKQAKPYREVKEQTEIDLGKVADSVRPPKK